MSYSERSTARRDLISLEFRRYLSGAPVKVSSEQRREFENFISVIDSFFALRAVAENRFREERHLAIDKGKSLPLDWGKISEILGVEGTLPPMRLIRKIAEECTHAMSAICKEPKKVLRRTREQVRLDKVQDIDASCLIQLSRRPGRTLAERSAPTQKILAISRRENFDLLENRVVKTFARLSLLASHRYLAEFEAKYGKYEDGRRILDSVRKLEAVCRKILADSCFKHVREVPGELPTPNYVLSQNTNYSKIYRFFVELVKQHILIESLWQNRESIKNLFNTINERQNEWRKVREPTKYARFYSELWLNPQSVKSRELVESPELDLMPNRIRQEKYSNSENERFLISTKNLVLNMEHLPWSVLVQSRIHKNAKPYLHDENLLRYEECAKKVNLTNVQALVNVQDSKHLKDYFEQLIAKVHTTGQKVENLVLIVSDSWKGEFLEKIITSCPFSRNRVTLLWNSIASAHFLLKSNLLNRQSKVGKNDISIVVTKNDQGTLVPWRQRKTISAATSMPIIENEDLLVGAEQAMLLLSRGEIPYYDFLEPMYLVVQTEREEIELKTIIRKKEKYPGGKIYKEKGIGAGKAGVGFSCLSFNLLWSGEEDIDILKSKPLKLLETDPFKQPLENASEILIDARITPGQGLAQLTAICEDEEYLLDYEKMKLSGNTCVLLEKNMCRSFPPIAPYVLSDPNLWRNILNDSSRKAYLTQLPSPWNTTQGNDLFAQASYLFPARPVNNNGFRALSAVIPENLSNLERFRRTNVFGNAPSVPKAINDIQGLAILKATLPDENFDFPRFFKMLKDRYVRRKRGYGDRDSEVLNIVRLIAWTYQADSEIFKDVKNDILEMFISYTQGRGRVKGKPARQHYTLLANLCTQKKEVSECLRATYNVLLKPVDDAVQEDELRLLYNLLMFNPNAITWVKWRLEEAKALWEKLMEKSMTISTARAGEALKALLYLLRYRIIDKEFLRKGGPQDFFYCESKAQLLKIQERFSRETLPYKYTVCILNFLDGTGTINGIPQG